MGDASVRKCGIAVSVWLFIGASWFAPGLARAGDLAPAPFLWGAANASFQVEGAPEDSNWRRFTRQSGRIQDGTNADVATDFWNRYEEDFALAEKLGLNSFRISLAWERIEPRKGEWDAAALAHYAVIIAAMRSHGLEPLVTLQHFTLPGWLVDEGGILSPNFVSEFAEYAEHVVPTLSAGPDGVKYWLTLNEPELQCLLGYELGVWPPGNRNALEALRALVQLSKAHIEAVRRLRPVVPNSVRFSIAKNWRYFVPATNRITDRIAVDLMNAFTNDAFIASLTTGRMDFRTSGENARFRDAVDLPEGRSTLDFIGINYYTRSVVRIVPRWPFYTVDEPVGPQSDMGWEIYPQGLGNAAELAYRRFHLPILITENGIADASDAQRGKFVRDHLESLQAARARGVPILGYFHWSLTDNFEWADGLSRRFGLVEVDYATLERKPRASFFEFRKIIHESKMR